MNLYIMYMYIFYIVMLFFMPYIVIYQLKIINEHLVSHMISWQ